MTRAIGIVVLIVAALGIAAGWLVGFDDKPRDVSSSPPAAAERVAADTPAGRFYRLPMARARVAALVLAGPAGLDRQALTPAPLQMPSVRITRLQVPRPVDVDFADMDLVYPGTADTDSTADSASGTPADRQAARDAWVARQLNPNIDDYRPRTDDEELFNQNTGLRGFMTQGWFNESVGIQGGLAIPSERTRDDNQSLSDQMAVGMGVLFAF
ncbi:hypothetical protein [uncultured Salinisphaera sp.]|uniref:hypothetical protein n=1 Tax=uncultured Salinisphaera sp. TaxID=359372 RepID=UPI0032B1BB99|tara:strand:- start:4319 stop:4957 length:639 start_codon:yes stop_codon:yes gene_type:complete